MYLRHKYHWSPQILLITHEIPILVINDGPAIPRREINMSGCGIHPAEKRLATFRIIP